MNNSAWTYKTFLQKTCCCFIASLLLIARAVILLESWTRAQDLLENCHFTNILPFNVSFPSKKTTIPRNCHLFPSDSLHFWSELLRVRGETPNPAEGSSFNLSHEAQRKSKKKSALRFPCIHTLFTTHHFCFWGFLGGTSNLTLWSFTPQVVTADSQCWKRMQPLSFLEFIETALGDSPSPIQLAVAQDCLQHFAEAPIEDGRNTSFNSARTTDSLSPNHFFGW